MQRASRDAVALGLLLLGAGCVDEAREGGQADASSQATVSVTEGPQAALTVTSAAEKAAAVSGCGEGLPEGSTLHVPEWRTHTVLMSSGETHTLRPDDGEAILQAIVEYAQAEGNQRVLSLCHAGPCAQTWVSERGILYVARWAVYYSKAENNPRHRDSWVAQSGSTGSFWYYLYLAPPSQRWKVLHYEWLHPIHPKGPRHGLEPPPSR